MWATFWTFRLEFNLKICEIYKFVTLFEKAVIDLDIVHYIEDVSGGPSKPLVPCSVVFTKIIIKFRAFEC
jgi:hypothetical protein